jgi:hypothetical protein
MDLFNCQPFKRSQIGQSPVVVGLGYYIPNKQNGVKKKNEMNCLRIFKFARQTILSYCDMVQMLSSPRDGTN